MLAQSLHEFITANIKSIPNTAKPNSTCLHCRGCPLIRKPSKLHASEGARVLCSTSVLFTLYSSNSYLHWRVLYLL